MLIKFKAELSDEIEGALSLPALELKNPLPARLHQWLDKHQIQKVRPVYPESLRNKKENGRTHRNVADATRARFSSRSSRAAERPLPEVLRTYVIDAVAIGEAAALIGRLQRDAQVEFAEIEQRRSVQFLPNDPFYASQNSWGQGSDDLYGLMRLNCAAAWDLSNGSNVVVAVIDTGVDYRHPDLTNNIWRNAGEDPSNQLDDDHNGFTNDMWGWNFVLNNNDPVDYYGHGTHVSGTIAAEGNNALGVIGVAWGARIMALKGIDDSGFGKDSDLANAIVYAANNGADVINASWGDTGYSATIEDAINYAVGLGVVFIAAAGNDNRDVADFFPAGLSAVINVGATDASDLRANFSDFGWRLDVTAPGVSVLSLRAQDTYRGQFVGNDYTVLSGTSMAAPHTAGAVALLLSAQPSLTVEQVRQVLRLSAYDAGSPGFDKFYGYGRINSGNALATTLVSEARIFSPSNRVIATLTNTFSGVARGGSFVSYILDYGTGEGPASWTVLCQSSNAVDHAALGGFDSGTSANGFYTVRLRVFDSMSRIFEDRIQVEVRNSFFTDPATPKFPCLAKEFKPGPALPLRGTAIGAGFRSYALSWAHGSNAASGWSSAGISLSPGGEAGITNALLGTWDTSSITQADFFTIRLSVDQTSFMNETKTVVYLEPNLFSTNWPKWLADGSYYAVGLLPLRQSNGTSQIVWGGQYGTILRFSADGFSVQTNVVQGHLQHELAARNLNGTAAQELVIPGVQVLRPDGTFYQLTTTNNWLLPAAEVALADLDGDGIPDPIAGVRWESTNAMVFAWGSDGQILAGFPFELMDANPYRLAPRMVVADLDGDGKSEIILAYGEDDSSFILRAFKPNGQPLDWPRRTYPKYFWSIAGADLDQDGKPEILLCYSTEFPYTNFLDVISADGTRRPGWPRPLSRGGTQTFIAVADLDADGQSEIIVAEYSNLLVLRNDGTPFPGAWPILGGDYDIYGPPLVADIDGDGVPEIVVSRASLKFWTPPGGTSGEYYHDPSLVAYRRDGTVARSWRFLGFNGNQPHYQCWPLIGDFNNDGKTDIALKYMLIGGGGVSGWLDEGLVSVLALNTPYRPHVQDWPRPTHDAQNTASAFVPARLRVSTSPQRTSVAWPASRYAADLQQSASLTSPTWTNVLATMTTSNGFQRVDISTTNSGPGFLRLKYR